MMSDEGDSLWLLIKKEWQERFALFDYLKRATRAIHTLKRINRTFALSLSKNEWFARKPNSEVPTLAGPHVFTMWLKTGPTSIRSFHAAKSTEVYCCPDCLFLPYYTILQLLYTIQYTMRALGWPERLLGLFVCPVRLPYKKQALWHTRWKLYSTVWPSPGVS